MSDRAQVRDYIWTPWEGAGSEHLRLWPSAAGGDIQVDSQVVLVADEAVLRVSYRIVLDAAWRVRSVRIASEQPDGMAVGLALQSDRAGHWRDGNGAELPDLDGCIDIDISATPFTNTLPIRRLHLDEGQDALIKVAYILVPSLELASSDQRYAKLADGRIRFESIDNGFNRDLDVDRDGIVASYPELFHRVWPKSDSATADD